MDDRTRSCNRILKFINFQTLPSQGFATTFDLWLRKKLWGTFAEHKGCSCSTWMHQWVTLWQHDSTSSGWEEYSRGNYWSCYGTRKSVFATVCWWGTGGWGRVGGGLRRPGALPAAPRTCWRRSWVSPSSPARTGCAHSLCPSKRRRWSSISVAASQCPCGASTWTWTAARRPAPASSCPATPPKRTPIIFNH